VSVFEAFGERRPSTDRVPHETQALEPFLHFRPAGIYNPLTGRSLAAGQPGFRELGGLRDGTLAYAALSARLARQLRREGWLVEAGGGDLARRFRLRYVSLEANTACNQSCYFCPVSTDPRAGHTMSPEFYEGIVGQLAAHRATIEAVSMVHYNEPTADRWFVERIEVLHRHGLPAAVLTNGTGLTPRRVDAIVELGGLAFLSVNLSSLDRERYRQERGGDHLELVLRNLDYMKGLAIAPRMEIVVLGLGDRRHRQDFHSIAERFAGSAFETKYYETMDRAGNVATGHRPEKRHRNLCGCAQTGSRPVEWVHVTPHGKCVLCCQDYFDRYVVGDLHEESLDDILGGSRMALLRRWVYGLEEAPDDFICRDCIYALSR
jgi:pyruvate-formate lyase-activating enzyme